MSDFPPFSHDHAERAYAGVLGKIIGVYLGRPFEQWSYDRIQSELGEIRGYVHERLGKPLVVTDDDISGTFAFLRALSDRGSRPDLTAGEIGRSWLNYLVEERTILWWGGIGRSTEHTAFMRLKAGIPAPESGATATNGQLVAEQIGAQIFIDGWGLINPADPERAAHFARLAGSVSHDGVAIHGAQVVAALVAQAFVEEDIDTLIDTALAQIPADSGLRRMVDDVRNWNRDEPDDWKANFLRIRERYGYEKFGGGCHMIPNHALIQLALLHGQGSFDESMMVVNTAGYDTDCNSGNVGCILGVRNGLAGLDSPREDWRGPVRDRLFVASAEAGECISDAVRETDRIVAMAHGLRGQASTTPPNRFHFSYPGSVQGFATDPETGGEATVGNAASDHGDRALAIGFTQFSAGQPIRITTPTFLQPDELSMPGYHLMACPLVYPGQTLEATVAVADAAGGPVDLRLTAKSVTGKETTARLHGPTRHLEPGESATLSWTLPQEGPGLICDVGIEIVEADSGGGRVLLHSLGWTGAPDWTPHREPDDQTPLRAWLNGVDKIENWWNRRAFTDITQNEGHGLLLCGNRDWVDYSFSATLRIRIADEAGIAVRCQGMHRYLALILCGDGQARLVESADERTVLAESAIPSPWQQTHDLRLTVRGNRLVGEVNGDPCLEAEIRNPNLDSGGCAIVLKDGGLAVEAMKVAP